MKVKIYLFKLYDVFCENEPDLVLEDVTSVRFGDKYVCIDINDYNGFHKVRFESCKYVFEVANE